MKSVCPLGNSSMCIQNKIYLLVQLRFLLSVLPLLNIPAAAALAWLWRQRARSTLWNLTSLAAAALLALNLTLTVLFLTVSRDNYPGGKALLALHDLRQNTGELFRDSYMYITNLHLKNERIIT